jgi:predicted Zn-dependent protease
MVDAWITWIAYDGLVYQLAAGTPGGGLPKYDGILRSFARGFRPLRDEDRARIDELRLRIAVAREGETLEELSVRTGNAWNVNETAVANALFIGQPLREGQLVKIARRERYEPRRQPEGGVSPPEGPVQGPLPAPVER